MTPDTEAKDGGEPITRNVLRDFAGLEMLGHISYVSLGGGGIGGVMEKWHQYQGKGQRIGGYQSQRCIFVCFTPCLQHDYLEGWKKSSSFFFDHFSPSVDWSSQLPIQLPKRIPPKKTGGCDLKLGEHCSKPRLVVLYRGWNPTQLYRDYFISHEIRIPSLTNQYKMRKSGGETGIITWIYTPEV